jgi:superfamily I DNA/RNA helicase
MDKRIVFAVAGSGKTSLIIENLNLEKRALVITYTNANINNLRRKIIKKFGFFPENIKLFPYFKFLYSFCFKPLLSNKYKIRGINFEPNFNRYIPIRNDNHFIDSFERLYSNRISKLFIRENILDEINERVEKYFDELYIDEIQDFGGNDFNFIETISKANINILFVGDFFQYTFDTSRDGSVNGNLHNDYVGYRRKFELMGLNVDTETLDKSWRCSPNVCDFVTTELGIRIASKNKRENTSVTFLNSQDEADEIICNNEIVKLFYSSHFKFNCFSNNWGATKGEDHYHDVCVILTDKARKLLMKNQLNELPPTSKNKLYVACTRAKGNLYIIPPKLIAKYKK